MIKSTRYLFPPMRLIIIAIFLNILTGTANAAELNSEVAKLLDNRSNSSQEQMMMAINKLDTLERTYVLQQGVLLFASNQEEFQQSWLLAWVFAMCACSEEEILKATKPFVDSPDERLMNYINKLRTKEELKDIMIESTQIQKEFGARIMKSDLASKFSGRLTRCAN